MNGESAPYLRPRKLLVTDRKQVLGVNDCGGLLADLLDDVITGMADYHAAVDAAVAFGDDGGGRLSKHHLGDLACLTESLLPGFEPRALNRSSRNGLCLHKALSSSSAGVGRWRRWPAPADMVGGAGGAGWPPMLLAPIMPDAPAGLGGTTPAVAVPPAAGPAPASAPTPLAARLTPLWAAMAAPYTIGVATAMISPPVNAEDPPSTPATILGTNQQSARKMRDSPTMSSAPIAGFGEVATAFAAATQLADSAIPTPISRNRIMIFTPTPTASAMYFST